jgi:hypothetical protein
MNKQSHDVATIGDDHDEKLTLEMPKNGYPAHPIANVLPMLEGEELNLLVQDIQSNGLRDTMVLSPDRKVLEGRNRQNACLIGGVKPRFRLFDPNRDGVNMTEFVVSKNIRRRHLSPTQRATLAAELIPFLTEELEARDVARQNGDLPPIGGSIGAPENRGGVKPRDPMDQTTDFDAANESQVRGGKSKKATTQAAAMTGASVRTVERVAKIKKDDPAAFEEMKTGKKSAHAAESGKPSKGSTAAAEYEKALKRIENICGKQQADAIREGDLMRNRKEVIAYADLTDKKMLAIRSLIDQGWSVKKATHFKAEDLLPTHTIRQAMHRAIYAGGGFTQKVIDESSNMVAMITIDMVFKEGAAKRKRPKTATGAKPKKTAPKKKAARKH